MVEASTVYPAVDAIDHGPQYKEYCERYKAGICASPQMLTVGVLLVCITQGVIFMSGLFCFYSSLLPQM